MVCEHRYMWGMNEGETAEFDLVWRGYHRRQVDRCFEQLEAKLIESLAERELLATLPAQLSTAQSEIDRLRTYGPASDARVLSAKLELILTTAEEEAARLRQEATAELTLARQEANKIRTGAHEQAMTARRDFELALRGRREKERRADEALHAAAEAEAREIVAAARLEAARLHEGSLRQRLSGVKPAPAFLRWVTRRRRTRAWA